MMDTDGRAVTRGRMHMCMWMLAQQYGEVVRPICVANEKSMRLALWSRPFAPRIEMAAGDLCGGLTLCRW